MSNIIKLNLNFDPITESSVMRNELSDTSMMSPFLNNNKIYKNIVLSSTSENVMIGGGDDEVKSSDIDHLINMLTSETSTNTNQLENDVQSRIEQNGGDMSTEQIESRLYNILKQNGGNNKNLIKLNLPTLNFTETENNMNTENFLTDTTTELSAQQGGNATSEISHFQNINDFSSTSEMSHGQIGGVRKLNPWMIAFGEIRKLVADELKIPNGKGAMQIAKVVYDDAKKDGANEKNVVKIATELLNKNLQKYKKLA
jgi:hypothetical protein